MLIRNIPLTIFNERVRDIQIFNAADFAAMAGYPDSEKYPDRNVAVGEIAPDIFARQDIDEVRSKDPPSHLAYLSLHLSLEGSVLARNATDGAFSIIAGRRECRTWAHGRGTVVHQDVWAHFGETDYQGSEELGNLGRLLVVAGEISQRVRELMEAGGVDLESLSDDDSEPSS